MGAFDTVKSTQVPQAKEPIVKAKKTLKKGYLFGHISNGDGLIRLDNGFAIRVIALDEQYVTLYLVDYGQGVEIMPQTWQKTKTVKKEKETVTVIETKEVEEENLFD